VPEGRVRGGIGYFGVSGVLHVRIIVTTVALILIPALFDNIYVVCLQSGHWHHHIGTVCGPH
jgi:hypothetical protein